MLGAVMQSQAGDGEPSGGHRGTESAGVDDLEAVALDVQRDTSTSSVGFGVDAGARTAGELSPERLGAIRPLFDAAHSLIGEQCAGPKRGRGYSGGIEEQTLPAISEWTCRQVNNLSTLLANYVCNKPNS